MKDLKDKTVTTIVNSLIAARQRDIKSLQEAEQMGHLTYHATIQQTLDDNAAALRDLNEDVAPWLQYHTQLRDVFAASANAPLRLSTEAS